MLVLGELTASWRWEKKAYADKDLANHDTNDFEILYTGNPVLAADLVGAPALGPHLLEQRLEVTNGEEDVALETETGTGKNGMAEVPRDGGEGILLDHVANRLELLGGGLLVDRRDKVEALHEREVGPVDAVGSIRVVGAGDMAEDAALLGAGANHELIAIVAAGGPMGHGDFAGNNVIAVVVVMLRLLIREDVLAIGLGIETGLFRSHVERVLLALASLASRSAFPFDDD